MSEVIAHIANTPEQMQTLIEEALGRLTIARMETWFAPVAPTPLERFIIDVMKGTI